MLDAERAGAPERGVLRAYGVRGVDGERGHGVCRVQARMAPQRAVLERLDWFGAGGWEMR